MKDNLFNNSLYLQNICIRYMPMRNFLLMVFFCYFSVDMSAGTDNREISINGSRADRIVTEISYEADNVTLLWSDNTTMCDKMAKVMTDIASGDDIDKAKIVSISGLYKDNLLIDGINPGSSLDIFDIQGKMLIHDKAMTTSCRLDISNLNTGIYLLRADHEVIKFIKQ